MCCGVVVCFRYLSLLLFYLNAMIRSPPAYSRKKESALFLIEVNRENPTYIFFLFQTSLNLLPKGVEARPASARYYPGALTTRLEC